MGGMAHAQNRLYFFEAKAGVASKLSPEPASGTIRTHRSLTCVDISAGSREQSPLPGGKGKLLNIREIRGLCGKKTVYWTPVSSSWTAANKPGLKAANKPGFKLDSCQQTLQQTYHYQHPPASPTAGMSFAPFLFLLPRLYRR